ncbi:winged helix-turn-helix domain-containing protein [Psychromonas ingrahamii]|uniref:winged helix-turn-helix domain-containing protein n=1 Tax=Psychromonas ingrahamii TaxID=357794 RepID=UPI0038CD14CA
MFSSGIVNAAQGRSIKLLANCLSSLFDSNTHVIDLAIRVLRSKVDKLFEPKLTHTIREIGYVLDVIDENKAL